MADLIRVFSLEDGAYLRTYTFHDDNTARVECWAPDSIESATIYGDSAWAQSNLAFFVSLGYVEITLA